jgi:hypothetical protein
MNRPSASKAKSTNPFDTSSEDEGGPGLSSSDDDFYDCVQDDEGKTQDTKRRSAPLDFTFNDATAERPAMNFDQAVEFSDDAFSPLENAMLQLSGQIEATPRNVASSSFSNSEQYNFATEQSPLLRDEKVSSKSNTANENNASIPSRIHREEAKNLEQKTGQRRSLKANLVLKVLNSGDTEFAMDHKIIVLEDLGTASSWLILLLPYIAFVLCLLLESYSNFRVSTTGPLSAELLCASASETGRRPVIRLAPSAPCHSPFTWNKTGSHNFGVDQDYMQNGILFESGMIPGIPVLSPYIYGDATFQGLSTEAVALVATGTLVSSIVILQRDTNGDDWNLMFSSNPKQVSMACNLRGDKMAAKTSTWDCKSPRVLDVEFSMPETAVYAGGDIRINISYFFQGREMSGSTIDDDVSFVYTKARGAAILFSSVKFPLPDTLVDEIAISSSYTFEHMSTLAMMVDTGIRLVTSLITVCFIAFWCSNMGMKSFFDRCSTCGTSPESSKWSTTLWWESPWIVFPERRYILVLLFSLLLMQEPVLAAMYFFPALGENSRLHLAADAMIGIGVQGCLFVYLVLFHGLRYHTASVARRRAEHQRQVLRLRRAAKYVTDTQDNIDNSEKTISQYTDEYYDRFGDTDGSASTGHLRLQSDPCGDGWADFLLPKLLLFAIGVTSVIATAYCRFPPEDENVALLSERALFGYKQAYVASSIVQFTTVLIWIYMIVQAALATGRKLRTEPFLSTRHAQLAYRVVFANVALSLGVLAVAVAIKMTQLLKKWSPEKRINDDSYFSNADRGTSKLEITIRVLSQVAHQFPYSGTAASIDSGRIFFATVSILITAFVFLPSHTLDDDETGDLDHYFPGQLNVLQEKLKERRRRKRLKRLVVNLARDSKTWLVFPTPIKFSAAPKILGDTLMQIYQDLRTDSTNMRGRGVVSIGPYTPVFCLELACWLNEASWQAYYSPVGLSTSAAERMKLEAIGLRLEGAVFDDLTDTQAYVATNISPQVDGEEDSIIVIAFRGTANAANLKTDFRSRQVRARFQFSEI